MNINKKVIIVLKTTLNYEIVSLHSSPKLTYLNYSEQALNWIKSYLSYRKQCVRINNVTSPLCECPVGVPQGSILGLILFTLYINDLPEVCKNVDVQLYADDAVIFTHGKNYLDIASQLTSVMAHIDDWLNKSCLHLNTKKTFCMAFTKQSMKVSHSNVFFRGQELDIVNEFKYLGVIFDSTLTFKCHVKNWQIKLNSICGILNKSGHFLIPKLLSCFYML